MIEEFIVNQVLSAPNYKAIQMFWYTCTC